MKYLLEKPRQTKLTHSQRSAAFWLRIAICSFALVAALLSARTAIAQGITGSITGTVTDSTGASIPGATVTVTQISTNSVHTVTSSDVGSFTIPQLQPGDYSVKIDKANFKGYEQQHLILAIDQVAQVNAALTAGSQGETVTVTSTAPVIQTEDSSVGLVVDSQAI